MILEDRILVWKLNRGSTNALSRIYEKYRDALLRLAIALLNDKCYAEDIVQDVFLKFAESAGTFKLTGSLKGFLATCVANRARNSNRSRLREKNLELSGVGPSISKAEMPDRWISNCDELEKIGEAMALIPYEQREAVTLRLCGELKFKEIAEVQEVSIKTAQSRYRCGLDRLRSLLNSKVQT